MTMSRGGGGQSQYHCSFCAKDQSHVRRLVAGPGGVYICNECVEACRDVIREEAGAAAAQPDAAPEADYSRLDPGIRRAGRQ